VPCAGEELFEARAGRGGIAGGALIVSGVVNYSVCGVEISWKL
jgi:hypothetical protein